MQASVNRRRFLLTTVVLAAACGLQQGDTGKPSEEVAAPKSGALTSGPDVLVQRSDPSRTGWYSTETTLTPSNVNTATFGKLFTVTADGYVYAQPLYRGNVTINGTAHNVLIVATQHDSLYAYDADFGTSLWHTSFINPPTVTTQPSADTGTTDIIPEVGITSTPVIDPATGNIYVVTKTKESGTTLYRMHVVDITTGAEKLPSVKILPSVTGSGSGSSGGTITLNAAWQQQRPGLVLVNGVVYALFGSSGDNFTWHGWMVGYHASDLTQASVLNVTPNGNAAGLWMSGEAPPVDTAGNLFLPTGNGDFDGVTEFGDSLIKVSTSGTPTISDYFAPFNQAALSASDLDFASAGVVLLPDVAGTAAHPHLLVTSGKTGTIYVLDRDSLGGYRASYTNPDNQIVQEIWNALGTSPINNTSASLPYVENSYSSPAYFRDASGAHHLYFGGVSDKVKSFTVVNGLINTTPASQSATAYGFPGASPVVSSNGSSNAIVWAYQLASVAILHAYDPQNLANEFYNSSQAANNRDQAGAPVKFCNPVVVNGRVYIGLQGGAAVFGLLSSKPPQAAAPTYSPGPGSYASSINVTLSSTTPGASIHYTLDGTLATISSPKYSSPIAVTATTTINAVAIANGFQDSFSTGTFTIGASAVVAFVQGASSVPQTPQSSVGTNYAGAQGAGNLNVVIVGWNGTSTVTSVTDTLSNPYILAIGPTTGTTGDNQSIYYARNISTAQPGANTVTVNFSGPATFPDIRILEYSGLDPTNPLDVVVGSSGNSSTSSSGTLITTSAHDLLVAGNVVATLTTGAGTGFTSRIVTNPDGDIAEDQIVTAAGSYTATAPLSPAGVWLMQMVAFKAVGTTTLTPPTAPTGLTATAAGSAQIDLAWTNTSATQTGVKIERSPDNVTFTQIAVAAAAATSYSDSGLSASTTYYYRVRATNAAGDSPYTNVASATTQAPQPPPTAPSNLNATAVSASQINLAWTNTAPPTGTQVLLERSADNVTFVLIATLAGSVSTYSDSVLIASTTYFYRAHATNAAGSSANSNTASATTQAPPPPPTAPTGLVATAASSNQINLSWTNTSSTQTGVKIERSTDGVTFTQIAIAAAAAVTYSDTGLASSTTYTYRVRATSGAGNSPYSNVASATTQAQSATLAFVQVNSGDPQSSSTSAAVTYTAAQTAGNLNVVIVGWNDSTATVSSVTDGKGNPYSLAVGPTVLAGSASQSIYYAKNIAAAVAGTNTVTVTFSSAAAFPDIRILEYSGVNQTSPVDGAIATTGNSASSTTASLTTTNAHDLLVAGNIVQTGTTGPGTGFTSRVITLPDSDIAEDEIVSAVGSYSASAPLAPAGFWVMQMVAFKSATVAPPPPPPAPTGLSATAVGTNEIDLSWTNGSTNQTGVKIERSPDGVTYTQVTIAAATATTFADTGLIAALTYYYRIRATNGTTDSSYTAVASATTLPLSPPGNPSATAASSSQINLAWTNTNPNHSGTKIERSTDGVTFTQITVAASGAVSYADTGLSVSTQYYYRLRATNFTTDSPYTAVVTAITLPLAAPSAFTATAASSTQITLAWTNNNSNQTGVDIERSLDGVTFTQIAVAAATATSYSDTGLTALTTYFYRLRATNGTVNSAYSSVASAKTLGATPAPTPPTNLAAAAPSSTQINLTWTNTSAAGAQTGVRIERSVDNVTFTQIALTTTATATSYADSGLIAATTYYYRVRATNGTIDSGYSSVASAKTLAGTPAPIVFVQVNSSDPQTASTTVNVTYSQAQAVGDLNVVIAGWNDSTTTATSVTDTRGNVYTAAVGPTVQSGVATQTIFYAKNIAASAAGTNVVSVHFSGAAAFPDIRILEYSGIDQTNPVDVSSAATGNSGTANSGAKTTTNPNDLIVGADLVQTFTGAVGAGFTGRVTTNPDGDIAEDRVVSAVGSYSGSATLSPAGQWIMQMVAFRAAIH